MLKLYRRPDAGFVGQQVESWDRTWAEASVEAATRWAEICHLRQVFDRYFPRRGRIIEGGCGLGQFVIHYRQREYDIEGVDFSAATVARLRQLYPDLPVRIADVTALPYRDGSFECYYSGGVVEHFEDGPFRALGEARRVLVPGGTLIVTVPFMNPWRRLRPWLDRRRTSTSTRTIAVLRRGFFVEPPPRPGLEFSEYYFTFDEFVRILRAAGFEMVEGYPCDVEWGEFCQFLYWLARRRGSAGSNGHAVAPGGGGAPAPALRRMWKQLFVTEDRNVLWRRAVLRALSASSGHMLLFVCRAAVAGVSH